MKKIILSLVLSTILITPLSALAYVNPGYGADLTCITSNNPTGYNCNDKTDMFKRIAELEKRVNELEAGCQPVSVSGIDRIASLEIRIQAIEETVKSLQENIMVGLRNILTFLIIKK